MRNTHSLSSPSLHPTYTFWAIILSPTVWGSSRTLAVHSYIHAIWKVHYYWVPHHIISHSLPMQFEPGLVFLRVSLGMPVKANTGTYDGVLLEMVIGRIWLHTRIRVMICVDVNVRLSLKIWGSLEAAYLKLALPGPEHITCIIAITLSRSLGADLLVCANP